LILHSQIALESGFQLGGTAMRPPAELFFGQRGKPALDQVDPRGAGRREVHVVARMAHQPAPNRGCFVRAVVIQNQVHVQILRHDGVHRFQKLAKLDRTVTPVTFADHFSAGDIQSGKQRRGAVALIIVRAAFDLTGRIGNSGCVRFSAWICAFSSTHNTNARSGGFRYKPTMSRTFSTNRGSRDSVNVSLRWGCSAKARIVAPASACSNAWHRAASLPRSASARAPN
jgi:hypothetical protein